MLLGYWIRDPFIPYGSGSADASEISGDSARAVGPSQHRIEALAVMTGEIRSTHRRLREIAAEAVGAPAGPAEAFAHLRKIPDSPAQGVILVEGGAPIAWAGQVRSRTVSGGEGTAVIFDQFYVTLQVSAVSGRRVAVATATIHADPPAHELTATVAELVAERTLVDSFRFSEVADTTGQLIATEAGFPLLRVDAVPLGAEQIRFVSAARVRGRAISLFSVLVFFLLAAGWSDRRKLTKRLVSWLWSGPRSQ